MTENVKASILKRGDVSLAYHHVFGTSPGVLFLGGFKSDMNGTKALALEVFCKAQGVGFTRMDYQGHGESSGKFEEGTIGLWSEDVLAIFDEVTEGQQIVVGSSMGGWMALLLALKRPERVAGLVGIAAAPDFTETLIWDALSKAEQQSLMETGVYYAPSCYGEDPYPITRRLIEEGRKHLLLCADTIPIACPVHLVHGMKDEDVPWQISAQIAEKLVGEDVQISLVKSGDHRMSEPDYLGILCGVVDRMIKLLIDF